MNTFWKSSIHTVVAQTVVVALCFLFCLVRVQYFCDQNQKMSQCKILDLSGCTKRTLRVEGVPLKSPEAEFDQNADAYLFKHASRLRPFGFHFVQTFF